MRVDTPASNQPDRGPQGPSGPQPDRAQGRLEALHRVGVLFYTYFAAALLYIVLVPLSAAFFVIDFLWQLILGGEGLSDRNMVAMWLMGVYKWMLSNSEYAFFGKGSFAWTAG
jgi:hypothetical protein